MCYTFQTNDYKTARWNSLEPCFYLEIDTVFIHVSTMGLDIILYQNLSKAIPVIITEIGDGRIIIQSELTYE